MIKLTFIGLMCLVFVLLTSAQVGSRIWMPDSASGIGVEIDGVNGRYIVTDHRSGWQYSGTTEEPISKLTRGRGHDSIGSYQELAFQWNPKYPVVATIRRYDTVRAVWFRLHYIELKAGTGFVFPRFGTVPSDLQPFSYQDRTFSPAVFGLDQTSTPWLFFDSKGQSVVISPASNFLLAKMVGDGKSLIGCGLVDHLTEVPIGLNQDSLMVFGDGIGLTWDLWGSCLRKLNGRRTAEFGDDVLLDKVGYWTDNGADYYYNYDTGKGYAGTLVDLRKHYVEQGIPLGYIQLDSWWYQKSINDPSGKPGARSKNSKLPEQAWNRYGGLMEYRADPQLFPNGLWEFQHRLDLPLTVHNRWIDRKSPYHDRYSISGVAAVDPRWWQDTMDYLADAGVTCYEQDWLDQIYLNSPEMATKAGVADAFADGMANATKDRKMKMQYCMGTPRFFLQGVKYSNLTTIRTSGDRFEPSNWAPFLYGSQLAQCVGMWPWCDVFRSGETGNMILSVLSGGPVGIGDALGKENRENIFRAARLDGVIVKPDRSILPCDRTYLDAAARKSTPFVASTFTDHLGLRMTYVFAFRRSKEMRDLELDLQELGIPGKVQIFDTVSGETLSPAVGGRAHVMIGEAGYAFLIIAPTTTAHIALFGDLGKFVSTGKQRIALMEQRKNGLYVKVSFAIGERSVTLDGISDGPPTASAINGIASVSSYGPSTGRFSVEVRPSQNLHVAEVLLNGR